MYIFRTRVRMFSTVLLGSVAVLLQKAQKALIYFLLHLIVWFLVSLLTGGGVE